MSQTSPLIIDSDLEFIHRIKIDPNAKSAPPILITNVKNAETFIASDDNSPSGIFVSNSITNPQGIPIVRLALRHKPTTPIFILRNSKDKEFPLKPEELIQLGIRKVLLKPVTYGEILKELHRVSINFNEDEIYQKAKQNETKLEEDENLGENHFVPILAKNFISGATSLFDVYARISERKFLKILKCGDAFQSERLQNYIKKGVIHFYIKREAQEGYLKYCNHLCNALLSSNKLSQTMKITLVANQGQETLSFLKNVGFKNESLQYAEAFTENVKNLVNHHLNIKKHEALREFLTNVVTYEHGIAVSILVSLLAKQMVFEADKCVSVLGLASLFHDVGLTKLPEILQNRDESIMTAEEIQLYQTHPTVGANLLSEIKLINPTVVQAVKQHHERRTRTGYPDKLGSGSINIIAEIVGICDEFAMLIEKAKTNPSLNPFDESEKYIIPNFSVKVANSFRAEFLQPR